MSVASRCLKRYALPKASPVEIVRHLMESNGLRQADVIDIFGSASIVSEVLRRKSDRGKSQRFHFAPDLFF
jgi:HTH-type transcriptional regulator/antitoxin HigA